MMNEETGRPVRSTRARPLQADKNERQREKTRAKGMPLNPMEVDQPRFDGSKDDEIIEVDQKKPSIDKVPEPTVAKVLKTLAGRGLVVSQRGARGGYRLTSVTPIDQFRYAAHVEIVARLAK